jgi:hypothetical protein
VPASSAFTVQDGSRAPVAGTGIVQVQAGGQVTFALVSSAGVTSWRLRCTWSDWDVGATMPITGFAVAGAPYTGSVVVPNRTGNLLVVSRADDGTGTVPSASCILQLGDLVAGYPQFSVGTGTLSSGTVTISGLYIASASANAMAEYAGTLSNPGFLSVSTVTAGNGTGSVTVTSSNGADASPVKVVVQNW